MKKLLSLFMVLLAFLIVSAQSRPAAAADLCVARAGTTVQLDDVKITDTALRKEIARLATHRLAVADIPMFCQDNFRFCVAGCTSSSPPSCISDCTSDLKQCIKDVALAEAEVD